MKSLEIQVDPVRNLTTGELCDLHVANVHIASGQLLCECSEGLYYCKKEDGLTCPDCGTQYERIDMAKTSKKTGKKNSRLTSVSAVDHVPPKPKEQVKPKKEVRIVKLTRHLKVKLTEEEIAQRSDEGAHCWAKLTELEAERKSYVARNTAQVAETKGKMDTLQQEVRDHCTYRDVDCNEIWDYDELVVKLVRLDTGAEFERRHMTRDELQLPLPDKKAPKADGTEKMACHGKVPEETEKALKESAVERLNEDGDLTASELRTRKRKQEQLLNAVDEAENTCGVPVKGRPSAEGDEDGEFVDEDDDAIDDPQ